MTIVLSLWRHCCSIQWLLLLLPWTWKKFTNLENLWTILSLRPFVMETSLNIPPFWFENEKISQQKFTGIKKISFRYHELIHKSNSISRNCHVIIIHNFFFSTYNDIFPPLILRHEYFKSIYLQLSHCLLPLASVNFFSVEYINGSKTFNFCLILSSLFPHLSLCWNEWQRKKSLRISTTSKRWKCEEGSHLSY